MCRQRTVAARLVRLLRSATAPARGRAASGTPDSAELPVKKNEPHAGGPIDPPKRQPRKGRPVISMPEAPGLVMGASRRPARPHEQTGVRHMQARRNPSPAATKSHAGGVCSDSLSGIRVLHQRGTCAGITEVQQPVPYRIR